MTTFSLQAQLAEVEREIVLRQRVYPGLIVRGKMRQSEADYHTAAMEAVRATLTKLINTGSGGTNGDEGGSRR